MNTISKIVSKLKFVKKYFNNLDIKYNVIYKTNFTRFYFNTSLRRKLKKYFIYFFVSQDHCLNILVFKKCNKITLLKFFVVGIKMYLKKKENKY